MHRSKHTHTNDTHALCTYKCKHSCELFTLTKSCRAETIRNRVLGETGTVVKLSFLRPRDDIKRERSGRNEYTVELVRGPAADEKCFASSAIVSLDSIARDYARLLGEIGSLMPSARTPINAVEASSFLAKVKYEMDVLKQQISANRSTRCEFVKPTTGASAAPDGSPTPASEQGIDRSDFQDEEPEILGKKRSSAATRSAGTGESKGPNSRWSQQLVLGGYQSKMVARALSRWTHRTICTALRAWVEHAGSERRRKRTLQKVVMRWTHQTSSAAFGMWRARVKEQRRMKWTYQKIVKKLMLGHACAVSACDIRSDTCSSVL